MKPMRTVSFKLTEELDAAIDELARRRGTSRSAVVREAIEAFGATTRQSVTARAGRLVGSIEGPGDLSTNKRYMDGFGE